MGAQSCMHICMQATLKEPPHAHAWANSMQKFLGNALRASCNPCGHENEQFLSTPRPLSSQNAISPNSNHTAHGDLNWRTPKECLTGETPDISPLQFEFCEKMEHLSPKKKCPETRKLQARHLGPTEHVGDALCFNLLLPNNEITSRSVVRPLKEADVRELRQMDVNDFCTSILIQNE